MFFLHCFFPLTHKRTFTIKFHSQWFHGVFLHWKFLQRHPADFSIALNVTHEPTTSHAKLHLWSGHAGLRPSTFHLGEMTAACHTDFCLYYQFKPAEQSGLQPSIIDPRRPSGAYLTGWGSACCSERPRSSETVVCSHLEVEPVGSNHCGHLTVSMCPRHSLVCSDDAPDARDCQMGLSVVGVKCQSSLQIKTTQAFKRIFQKYCFRINWCKLFLRSSHGSCDGTMKLTFTSAS